MADISELIEYYTNLLIIQYNSLPNASATIGLLAGTALADGVMIDVQNAYDIDTAVGVQLDVLGKYVGVDRYFGSINLEDYFAFIDCTQSLPTSPPAFGFADATNYNVYQYNGTLSCLNIVTSQNALSDANFLILIQLCILRNNMNFSNQSIDNAMWALFGAAIRPEQGNNTMTMVYFITGSITTLQQAIIIKKLLPKPMGVGANVITGIFGKMFAMVDCLNPVSLFGYGFADCTNSATIKGQFLSCTQITEY